MMLKKSFIPNLLMILRNHGHFVNSIEVDKYTSISNATALSLLGNRVKLDKLLRQASKGGMI